MKMMMTAFALLSLAITPAQAQSAPAKKAKTCEMMHDGKKMQGMMVKSADGKQTCKIMDHSQMDPSKMGHGKKEAAPAKPENGHSH